MSDCQVNETNFEELPIFYPPSNENKEEFEITNREFEQIKDAIKDEKFRKLLSDYVEEVQDPENQKLYQSEVRQLERENGNIVHFLNPIPGYVLKTSVDGQKKGFINICSNPIICNASIEKTTQEPKNGCTWSIPYAQSPMHEDMDKAGTVCQVYDVIFNPDVLLMASKNSQFRNKIEQTAIDAVENSFKVTLDRNNVKTPKLQFKGIPRATIIKYKIGQEPPKIVNRNAIKNEIPPQSLKKADLNGTQSCTKENGSKVIQRPSIDTKQKPISKLEKKLSINEPHNPTSIDDKERTVPRYSIKYRSHVELQDFCLDNQRSGSASKPIPDEIILTIDLPLLSDSSTIEADVLEDGWTFELHSNRKALYELKIKLPFKVQPESAKAKFEKDKRKLHVTIKTTETKKEKEPLYRSSSDESDVFEEIESDTTVEPNTLKKLVEEIEKVGDNDVGYESTESHENIPTVINGNVVVNSILKGSKNRFRSMSESYVEHLDHVYSKEDFMSLESLSESNEELTRSESSGIEKSVRFSDKVQRQLFRSTSSILGQKKKNQRKSKNKRKNRERHSSEGSASSYDDGGEEDDDHEDDMDKSHEKESNPCKSNNMLANKHKKKPCEVE